MRCLSVRQSFAGLIVSGRKTVELRSRRTLHRGPLVICAAARPWGTLAPDGLMGVALGIVDVIDCRPATEDDAAPSCLPPGMRPEGFAWVLADPRPIEPLRLSGMLGIFAAPEDLMRHLEAVGQPPPRLP